MLRYRIIYLMAFIGIATAAWLFLGTPGTERSIKALEADPERGRYVLHMAGCIACHTSKEGDFLGGGDVLETPFGSFYAPNITPSQAGIGDWSGDDFLRALVEGHGPQGSYYPVFPFTSYRHMYDQDIADLWAHLKAVPPSDQDSRPNEVSFPFSMRSLMRPWKTLFHRTATFDPDPERSEQWNRGAYLVNGPSHCGECHTPRNRFGAMDHAGFLKGAVIGKDEKVPAIDRATLVKDGWSEDDLIFALQMGMMPDGDFFSGSMGDVVEDSSSHLSDEDLRAIAHYLLTGQD